MHISILKKFLIVFVSLAIAGFLLVTVYDYYKPLVNDNCRIKIPVFMYHSVGSELSSGDKSLNVSPENFEKSLQTFKELNLETIFASQFSDEYSKKAVVITFDDGYENNYSVVYPLLKEYNMKATIFVATALIGTVGYLTREEIQEMSDSGYFEFGSHTHNHVNLDKCASPEEVHSELSTSKKILEEITGKEITVASYPGGFYDRRTLNIVKKYFKKAFLDRYVDKDYIYSSPYQISRYGVYNVTDPYEVKIVVKRILKEKPTIKIRKNKS